MEHVIDRLSNHYIVCGYGRMGAQIGRELTRRALAFVVIERDPTVLEMLRLHSVLHVAGDATSDSTLLTAGVTQARGLATALTGDADNALVVISAKGLNPRLQVVARASSRETEEKLLRAGADRVVTPYTIGGQRMALARLSGNRVLTQDGDGAKSLTLPVLGLFLPLAICIHNPLEALPIILQGLTFFLSL